MRPLVTSLALSLCAASAVSFAHDDFPAPVDSQKAGEHPPTPAKSVAAMTLPPGFKATLFAGEPDVRQPIAIDFDDRGRLWVAECYTYAGHEWNGDARDRVVILHDRDGDGRHDERKVFWDGAWALSGLTWGFGGLWVLHDGTLSFVPDRNGDDVPDGEPEIRLDGFNVDDVGHNIVSGLIWGPDGWLYGRHGILATSHPGRPGTPDDERPPLNCGIWRYHPTRQVFEVVCRGTTNPWGLDYDRTGQFFFTNNVTGHLWHVIPGAHYTRMYGEDFNPYLYELIDTHADHYHWDTGKEWQASRDAAAGSDELGGGHSHCGGMVYYGDNWPAEYRGHVYMCNTHGRRVNRDVPVRRGSGYVFEHAPDTLFANQPWFRGVSLAYGPDGGVYVTDWSDLGECHDQDGVHRSSGRVYKVTYGAPKPLPAGFDVSKRTDAELVRGLSHENEWFRRRARRLLQERSAEGGPSVFHAIDQATLKEDRIDLRLSGLWTLYATGRWGEREVAGMLEDGDEDVRAWSVKLLTDATPVSPEAAARLVRRAADEMSPFVRLHLASAMQRLDGEPRWKIAESLAARVEDADDHNLPLMIWYGVEPLVPNDVARAVRLAGSTKIPLVRRFVSRRVAEKGRKRPDALAALIDLLRRSDDAARSEILAGATAAFRGVRRADPPAGWETIRDELLASTNESVSRPAEELSVVFGDGRTIEHLKAVAADGDQPPAARREAIDVLVRSGDPALAPLLHGLIKDRDVAVTALRGLTVVGTDETPGVVLTAYRSLPGPIKPEAIAALTVRETWAAALLEAVRGGQIPKADVEPAHARQIAGLGSESVTTLLEEVWGSARETPEEIREQTDRLKGWLTPDVIAAANLPHGRQVYAKLCGNCHKLYGEGAAIGPDLTGSNRDNLDYLLHNVLDPSGAVPEAYRTSVVVLADGRVLTGVVTGKSAARLTLQTPTEKLDLDAAEVEEVRTTGQSLMPNGLFDRLTPKEVRDLIGYLSGRSQVPLPGG